MGKYMKKGKISGDVAVMEIPQPGVRTRARTLALSLQPNNNDLSFLQLRSRRLLKPPFLNSNNTPDKNIPRSGSKPRVDPGGGSVSQGRFGHFDGGGGGGGTNTTTVEDSIGENNFERSTRESTPCSLIRDSETIGTPGSTTRPTCSTAADRRARTTQRTIPTNQELEEFFADFHRDQQKRFMEKYNFDIINDVPLPGRYEWEKIE